jgi:peptidyl-prolyl cis-trans isomerase SurA
MNIYRTKLKPTVLLLSIAVGYFSTALYSQTLRPLGPNAASEDAPVGSSNKTGLRLNSNQSDNAGISSEIQKELNSGVLASIERDKEYSDFIVAVVDSEPITNREVNLRALEHLDQIRLQGGPTPPRESLLSKTLEELILEKAQLQMASETGLSVSDEELLQAQKNIAERNSITLEQLYAQVKMQGQSLDQYKARLKQQITLQKLRERDVLSRVKISDLEADQFLLEQQKTGASKSQFINISQILVAVPDGLSEAQLEPYQTRVREIMQKIKSGEDFGNLAKEYSDASDARNGGVMGLRSETRYPPLFVAAIKDAKPGQVVGPVKSGAGLHILKLLDRQQEDASVAMVTQTHARHILLRPGGQLSQNAARAQLTDFKRRIESGADSFENLAKAYSQDSSAQAGGDLGWASPGQFVPEFESVMARLSPGQIADPLISRFGVHLIQVLERKQAPISLKERRENAKKQMQEKKFEESYTNWERELRGRAFIEYREPPV